MEYKDPSKFDHKPTLKSITLIHAALLAGQFMFALVAISITENKHFDFNNTGEIFLFLVPLMALGSFLASNFMYSKLVAVLPAKSNLGQKLSGYLTALIVRCALLEGASLFGIVAFLLTGNLLYLVISCLIIIRFIIIRPTVDAIADAAQLSYEEKQELQ